MSAQDEYDDIIRRQERERIARHLKPVANGLLRDNDSDAIGGYVAAVILDLAGVIAANGEISMRFPARLNNDAH